MELPTQKDLDWAKGQGERTINPPSTEEEPGRDPVRSIEEAAVRGHRLKVFSEAAGLSKPTPSPPAPKPDEQYKIDIGQIFASQSTLIQQVLDKLYGERGSQNIDSSPYLKHLEAELLEMRQRLQEGSSDPLETMMQNAQRFKDLASAFKEHVGLPMDPGGMTHMIELERLRIESADRQRHHEELMEERRMQWARENRHREEEMRLRRLEFSQEKETRSHALGALGDLGVALASSIDVDRIGSDVQARKPKAFKCSNCGQTVKLDSPEETEAICTGCGALYDMVPHEDTAPAD